MTSFNIQVGIGSHRAGHAFLYGWKHVLPHRRSRYNLERIAGILADTDIVGLNEVDGGSFRSGRVNQAGFLADRARIPYWVRQRTRDFGGLAQHGNGLLSRWPIEETRVRTLPSFMNGRGMLENRLDVGGNPLTVVVTHLGLSRNARLGQIRDLAPRLRGRSSLLLMGDLNCTMDSPEMRLLLDESGLRAPPRSPPTFPSWRPTLAIDHILCSPDLEFTVVEAAPEPLSDHLALKARLRWVSTDVAEAESPG